MLPKTHIILGAIFSAIFWIVFPNTAWYNISLVFLSSFLIDFDHYMCAAIKNKSLSLIKALRYYDKVCDVEIKEKKKGIFRRGDFHIFHTIEFHAFVFAIGLFFSPFLYIFIGMLFHSFMDLISLGYNRMFYVREFFLVNWIRRKLF